MAITILGIQGAADSAKVAGTTILLTANQPGGIPAGTVLHIVGAWDNINSVTAPTLTCSAVGGGTAIANHATPIGSGVTTTAGAGMWHQCWRVVTTTAIAQNATIATLTSNQSAVARAAAVYGYAGASTTLRGTVATGTSTSGAASATTAGTALVVGDLVIGSVSYEGTGLPTADADTLGGSWSAQNGTYTTGGSAATNAGTAAQSKIVTSTSAQTYNLTGAGTDSIACVYSLQPLPPPAITQAAYRIYDDGTESGSTALAAQNTAPTVLMSAGNVNLQVRTLLQLTTAADVPVTDDFTLQWEKNASGTWTDVVTQDALVDRNAESGSSTSFSTSGLDRIQAQSFLGNGQALSRAGFYLTKSAGGTGTVVARLYAHTGTYGGASTPGTLLATSTSVDVATIATAGWYYFVFDQTVVLTNGTPYFIAVESTSTTSIDIRIKSGHAGNQAAFKNASSTWVNAGLDLAFEVYSARVSAPTTVLAYDSANLTGAAATTNRLTGGTGTFAAGEVSEDGQVNDLGWSGNNYTELLYSITLRQADLANGDTLRFRVLRNGATTDLTYTQYPTLTANFVQPVAITQGAYQFFTNGTESGSGAYASESTPPTINVASGDVRLQLRTRLQSTTPTDIPATDDFQLQWEKNASGTWTNVYGPLTLASSYPVSNYTGSTNTIGGPNYPQAAQSILGNGEKLLRVGFHLAIRFPVPDANLTAVLYAHVGGFGAFGTIPTGAPLATSTTVKVPGDFTTSMAWTLFDFDASFTLESGTPYFIGVISNSTNDNYLIGMDATDPTHQGVKALYVTSNGAWQHNFYEDLIHEVWTQPAVAPSTVLPYDSANLTHGAATINRLMMTNGTGTFEPGEITEDGTVTDFGMTGNNHTELLYSIILKQANLTDHDTIRFRVLRNGATTNLTYTQYPSITISYPPVPKTGTSAGAFSFVGAAQGSQYTPYILTNWFNGGPAGTALTAANSDDGGGSPFIFANTPYGDVAGTFTSEQVLHPYLSPTVLKVSNAAGTAGAPASSGFMFGYDFSSMPAMSVAFDTWVYFPTGFTASAAWILNELADAFMKAQEKVYGPRSIAGLDSQGTGNTGATAPIPLNTWYRVSGIVMVGTTSSNGIIKIQIAPAFGTPDAELTNTNADLQPGPIFKFNSGKMDAIARGIYYIGGLRIGVGYTTFLPDPYVPVPPKTGTSTGAFTFVGGAVGKLTPKAASTGAVNWVGTAVGKRVPKTTVTGAVSWVGAAAGTKTAKATSTGAFTFVGTVAGKRVAKAAVTGAISWVGSAAGKRVAKGTSTTAIARTNLATNPGYEVGTSSILSGFASSTSTSSVETTTPIAGTRSLLLTRVGSLNYAIAQVVGTAGTGTGLPSTDVTARTPVTPGQPITGGVSVKTSTAFASISAGWMWYDNAGAAIGVGSSTVKVANATANTVYRVTDVGTPPANAATGYLFVPFASTFDNNVLGIKVWADLLTIEYGTTDGSYFDGDTADVPEVADYNWTGTPNASTSTKTSPTSFTFAGAAVGKRVAKAVATGAVDFVGAANGTTSLRGTVAGVFTFAGAASGVARVASAPVVVGSPVSAINAAGTTLTFIRPAGLLNGDYLVAICRSQNPASTVDFASPGYARGPGPAFVGNSSGARVQGFYYKKVVDAPNEPAQYVFDVSGPNQRCVGSLLVIRGADATKPLAGPGSVYGGDAITNGRRVSAYPTGFTNAALILFAGGNEFASPNDHVPTATPAGHTQVDFVTTSTNTGVSRTSLWVGKITNTTGTTSLSDIQWGVISGPHAGGLAIQGSLVAPMSVGTSVGSVDFVGTATGSKPLRGSVTGAVSWAGTATGKLTPKATSTGAVTFVGTASGKRTPNAATSGAVTFAGAAAGKVLPKGSSTGAVNWVGAPASGKRTPKATVTGAVNFVSTASGTRVPKATSTGAVTFAGTASGKRQPKAAVTGAFTFVGAASGKWFPKGSSTGAVAWLGAPATGVKTPKAAVTGAFSFYSSASGYAPVVGAKTGTSAGAITWSGTVTGKRAPKAAATGLITWTGTVSGKRVPKASTTGAVNFVGLGTGKRTPSASVTGSVVWAGPAAGGKRTPKAAGTGAVTFVGAATGKKFMTATTTGAFTLVGAGSGKRTPKASVTGAVQYVGSAVGKRLATSIVTGTITWVISATGKPTPITVEVVAVMHQYGLSQDPPVRRWDGTRWLPVPTPPPVPSATVVGGRTHVVGVTVPVVPNPIEEWDDSAWQLRWSPT